MCLLQRTATLWYNRVPHCNWQVSCYCMGVLYSMKCERVHLPTCVFTCNIDWHMHTMIHTVEQY